MKYFFGTIGNMKLSFMGPIHLGLIIVTFVSILLIYMFRNKLRKSLKKRMVSKIMVVILLLDMIIYFVGPLLAGTFDYNVHIPIQYCFVTGFIFMYMLWFEKKAWFNFLYYAIFMCTIAVVIFFDYNVGYDQFQFYQLVISHHFLLVCSFYTLFVLEYPVDKSGYKKMLLYSFSLYAIVYVFNICFGTNYIFSNSLCPFIIEMFPFVLKFDYPLFWLLVVAIPLLFLAYIPVKYKK